MTVQGICPNQLGTDVSGKPKDSCITLFRRLPSIVANLNRTSRSLL